MIFKNAKKWVVLEIIIFIISVSTAFLISIRDSSIGTDTLRYISFFYKTAAGDTLRIDEPFFVFIAYISAKIGGTEQTFFFFTSLISLLAANLFIITSSKNIYYSNRGLAVAMLAIAILPFWKFFTELHVNIIRSGLSIPFIWFSFGFIYQRKFLAAIVFFLIALGFHSSSIFLLIGVPLLFFRARVVIFIIFFMAIFYASGFGEFIFRKFLSENFIIMILGDFEGYYTRTDVRYDAGVRLDFLLFSIFFLIFFYSRRNGFDNSPPVFYIYSSLLIPFLIFGFIPYSDRLLSAGWALIPLIISYYFSYRIKFETVFLTSLLVILIWPLVFFITTLYY